ncbi:MAG: hypothetical protein GX221_02095 [Candidatus Riflebacteria bacterium]|nr:hypothetical protein [Candidatus Riflebacteria bacterium]
MENNASDIKTLIVFCMPENEELASEALTANLPACFDKADYAISYSAQKRGWLRKLALKGKVFCHNEQDLLLAQLPIYDIMIVNPLSLNTLAKAALGIADSFPSVLISEFIKLQKPLLLSDRGIPELGAKQSPHLTKIYRRYWQDLLGGTVASFTYESLEQQTARIIRASKLPQKSLKNSFRTFVTKEDVIEAADSLQPLIVASDAIITDLALEEAAARDIIILREDG